MTQINQSATPLPLRRSWWGRNWKWAVPVLGVLPLLLCGGFATAICMFVFGLMKSSEPYKHAVAAAQANSAVVASIGSPMSAGIFPTGNINLNNSSGNADMAIPISGPKGSGKIYVAATETAGVWTYSTLAFQPSGSSQRVDLKSGQ